MRRLVQTLVALSLLALAPASAQQFYALQAGACTGGIPSSDGFGNTIITFRASGTLKCTIPVTAFAIVAAGGGGGASGGGAGNAVFGTISIPSGPTAITVGIGGTGGNGQNSVVLANRGTDSSIGALLSAPGGDGGVGPNNATVTNGGGCGSGNISTCVASAGTQPFTGGSVTAILTQYGAGGGGGARGPGASTAGGSIGGAGGAGFITTAGSIGYGGGGGGGVGGTGTGGLGKNGGGNGRTNTSIGIPASPASGGGGGGTGFNNVQARGGSGSNGVVIISCPTISCGPPLGAVTPYLGQVMTHTYVQSRIVASTTGWNSRTPHFARDNITSLQIKIGNWYTSPRVVSPPTPTMELGSGGTWTVTASIEYPEGTLTPVKFGGSSSVVIADLGDILSDAVSVNIPNGALAWVRLYIVPSTAILMSATARVTNTALGEATNNSNVDQTTSGTVTNTGGLTPITPIAIVAMTSQPSIGTLGSSRMVGDQDTTFDTNGDTGYTRLFGRYFAYIDTSLGGDTVIDFSGAFGTKRRALVTTYTTHLWLDPGLNDPLVGNSLASVETALLGLAAAWPYGPTKVIFSNEGAFTLCGAIQNYNSATTYFTGDWVQTGGVGYQSLIDNNLNNAPASSPVDWQSGPTTACSGWNQIAGQVPVSLSVEAFRVGLNSWEGTLIGYNQVVDANSFFGTGHNFQYWNTLDRMYPGISETPDGTHEKTAALLTAVPATIFNANAVTLP